MPFYLLLHGGERLVSTVTVPAAHHSISVHTTVILSSQVTVTHPLALTSHEVLLRSAACSVAHPVTAGKIIHMVMAISAGHHPSAPVTVKAYWGRGEFDASHSPAVTRDYSGHHTIAVTVAGTPAVTYTLDTSAIHFRANHTLGTWFHKTYGYNLAVTASHPLILDRVFTKYATLAVSNSVEVQVIAPFQVLIREIAVSHLNQFDLIAFNPGDYSDRIILDGLDLFYVDGDIPQEDLLVKSDEDDLIDGRIKAFPGSIPYVAMTIHGWAPSRATISRIQAMWGKPVNLFFRGHMIRNCKVTKFKKRRIEEDLWEYWLEIKEDTSLLI